MDRPLEIAFHNMAPSASLAAMIRQHAGKLKTRYGRLIGCRVSVEAPHRQHWTGNLFECHVVLSLPGRDLAVSRGPHRPKQHTAHPDVRMSIRTAFEAAARRLEDRKDQLRTGTTPPTGSALAGAAGLAAGKLREPDGEPG